MLGGHRYGNGSQGQCHHPRKLVFRWSIAALGGRGFRQTIFTRHAPSIMKKIYDFDAEFKELLKIAGVKPLDSRSRAIDVIEKIIAEE